jgi:hypothetical protein
LTIGKPVTGFAAYDVSAPLLANAKHRLAILWVHDFDKHRAVLGNALTNSTRETARHKMTSDFDNAICFASAQSFCSICQHISTPRSNFSPTVPIGNEERRRQRHPNGVLKVSI